MAKFWRLCFVICWLGYCSALLPIAAKAKTARPDFSFGIIADVQYCDCEVGGTRNYRASLKKLTACVQAFNAQKLSFVIQLGDVIDRDFTSFAPVLAIYRQLTAPAYHVLGNHDFLVPPEKRDHIFEELGLKTGYYDFTYHSWRFIVLDGNDLNVSALSPASAKYAAAAAMFRQFSEAGRANAQIWNGGIGREQMAWLKNSLEQATSKGERVILFCHFPVLPEPNIHNLWNNLELIELLESYPYVAAYLNGHNHAGGYAAQKGIHYLTFPAMVETPDQNAYAVLEVYATYLKVIRNGQAAQILPLK